MSVSLPALIPLILAGGRGTRIAHLHPDLPKPAVLVGGKPFLVWILLQLAHAGFQKAVVSSGHRALQLRWGVEPFVPAGMEIRWAAEESALGTGGGAAWAARCSGFHPQDWLVMNGDSYLSGKWPEKILRTEEATLVACQLSDTGRFGRLEEDNGRLLRFSEKTSGGPGWVNAGIYRLPASWLADLPEGGVASMETDIFPGWLREGRKITVLKESGDFLDIGTPESLARADHFVRQHLG